ncbi:MAG: tetratricopeptide repeat protein [Bacteroidales bacterium]|nr:tetratricopeptide repeat protein [Bacteroidales bacterium]
MAENTKIDSLENLLEGAKGKALTNMEKIKVLNALSKNYKNISTDKSIEYGRKALELAKIQNYRNEQANALYNIGKAHLVKAKYQEALDSYQKALKIKKETLEDGSKTGSEKEIAAIFNSIGKVYRLLSDYNKSLEYCQKALKIREDIGDKKGYANSLNSIGIAYRCIGNYNKAIDFYKRSLNISLEINDKGGTANSLNNIGNIYLLSGNYDKALENYLKSLNIREKIGDKNLIASSLNNIGLFYYNLNEYEKSLSYQLKSVKIWEEIGNEFGVSASLNNIGLCYENTGNFDQALIYHEKSLELSEKIGDKEGISLSLNNIGHVYYTLGKFKLALEYFRKSLKIKKDIGDKRGSAESLNNIGKLYLNLKNYNKAFNYLKEAEKLAKDIGAKNELLQIYNSLSDFYSATGNYQNSLQYYKHYTALKDSIFNEEKHKQITEMQTKYETEKKEGEIEILNKEKEIQSLEINKQKTLKYYTISIAAFLILLGFLLFNRFKLKQEKQQSDIEKQKQEIEKKLLRSQMNPHFIFNSLNSINSFITGKDTLTAQSYLTMFAELMRYILENTRKSFIPIEDEIKTLELNLELEKLRFNNKFDFKINITPNIDTENTYIPPMLVQPYVENAIIHGIMNKSSSGNINIDFCKKNDVILCSVIDDGVGRKKANEIKKKTKQKHKSIGLQLTNERLSLLNKQRKSQIAVKITDLTDENGIGTGTKVELSIPYESE